MPSETSGDLPHHHLPAWGWVARFVYRIAFGVFIVVWVAGLLFGSDGRGLAAPVFTAWIAVGALGVVALLVWLAAEFGAGRQGRQS